MKQIGSDAEKMLNFTRVVTMTFQVTELFESRFEFAFKNLKFEIIDVKLQHDEPDKEEKSEEKGDGKAEEEQTEKKTDFDQSEIKEMKKLLGDEKADDTSVRDGASEEEKLQNLIEQNEKNKKEHL